MNAAKTFPMPGSWGLGTAISSAALLGIARVRCGRAEEGAVERLMAAPSELPQRRSTSRWSALQL